MSHSTAKHSTQSSKLPLRLITRQLFSGLLALTLLAPASLLSQPPAASGEIQQLAAQIAKKINSLTNYGVFDDITFSFKDPHTVILKGYASRPTLKDDAARAAKSVSGITGVDNQIEVLPSSPSDDRVRALTYDAIYTYAPLRKYNANQGVTRPSVATAAGGITVDPPIGFHAIHIIVKNGNVILRGQVLNANDANMAKMRANQVFGVFSVDNQLSLEGKPAEK
jgi:hyperosmotically inducible periplasmic protein